MSVDWYPNILYIVVLMIITGITGVVGAWYGGKKTLEAATMQIKEQQNLLKEEKDEHARIMLSYITNILWHEIDYNVNELLLDKAIFKENIFKDTVPNYIYNKRMRTLEYDNIKSDLLKFNNGIIMEIIMIYSIFEILNMHANMAEFDDYEIQNIRKIFTIYEKIKNYCVLPAGNLKQA